MNDSERTALALLRAGIWGKDPAGTASTDWPGVIGTADRLAVLPIVADRIMKLRPEGLERESLAVLTKAMMDTLYTNDRVSAAMVDVFTRLEEAGMEPVLLKGHGNSVNYPDQYLRQCGDIDIYVGPDRYEEAGLMFGEEEDPILKTKHTHGKHARIPVEFHRTSAKMHNMRLDRLYHEHERKYLRKGFTSIMVRGKEIPLPEPTFNLFFLAYHVWDHFIQGGVGMKQVCDVCLFIDRNHDRLDMERLGGMIRTFRMERQWIAIMALCTDVLGLDSAKAPFSRPVAGWRTRYLLSIILKEGNFGFFSGRTDEKQWARRKFQAVVFFTIRYMRILPLFPAPALKAYVRFMTYQFFWQLFHVNVFPLEDFER